MDETRTTDMIDGAIAAAVLSVPRQYGWGSCCAADVAAVQGALDAVGFPANPLRRWFRGCPQSGTPSCNLTGKLRVVHGYMTTEGPARVDCRYCRGVGYLAGATPSTPCDLVSVAALGAERVLWAEGVLARQVAADLGVELRAVAWRVVSAEDVRCWPPLGALADRWVAALDAGADGRGVLGVRMIGVAALREAARAWDGGALARGAETTGDAARALGRV